MSDLISREALKNAFAEYGEKAKFTQGACQQLIDNAPTVETDIEIVAKDAYEHGYTDGWKERFGEPNERPQGEWIPVSERLPKEEDYRPCYGLLDGCIMWQTDNGDIGFGWYYNSTKCWSDIYDRPIKTGKVIAWQPLPELYKEGGEEE